MFKNVMLYIHIQLKSKTSAGDKNMDRSKKPVTVEKNNVGKPETKESRLRKFGRFLGKGLVTAGLGLALATGVGAKLGCSDDENGKTDAGHQCYIEKDTKGVEQCLPPTVCEKVPVNNSDGGATDASTKDAEATDAASTDATTSDASAPSYPVSEDGTWMCAPVAQSDGAVSDAAADGLDAGVSDVSVPDAEVGDLSLEDSGPDCSSTTENVAELRTTEKVKVSGVACGKASCEGVASVGDVLDMNGSSYTVKTIENDKLTAESGNYSLVAKKALTPTCRVFKLGVDQGSCKDVLNSAVYMVAVDIDSTNADGRVTLALSTSSSFSYGASTKRVMLTEGGSSKKVSLGALVDAEVELVKGTDGTAYVAVKVLANKINSEKPIEPLGMSLDEGKTENLNYVVYMKPELTTDNNNKQCQKLEAELNVVGVGPVDYADGNTISVNGKSYQVDVQYDDTTPSNSRVALVDPSASENSDYVIKSGSVDTVNGKYVWFTDLKVDGSSVIKSTSPDTGSSAMDAGSD
jgi:hypothetical protein